MESLKQLTEPLERAFRSQDRRLEESTREMERLKAKLEGLDGLDDDSHRKKKLELEERIESVKQERKDILDIKSGVAEIDRMYKALLDMKAREFRTAMEALADEVKRRRLMEETMRRGEKFVETCSEDALEAEGDLPDVSPEVKRETSLLCGICHEDLHDVQDEGAKCECGQVFHRTCASEEEICTSCNHKFGSDFFGDELEEVECPMCGEIVPVGPNVELLKANCNACHSILRRIDEGYNYLVVDDTPETAYREFKLVQKDKNPGLCLSTTFPDKISREFSITAADQYWFSDTDKGEEVRTLDPRRLDFETIRVIGNFLKNSPKGVIIIDGLEYLLVENGFGKVLQFIKRVNDLASLNKATIFVSLTPFSLEKDQFARLRKEFDRVQELAS